jgi:hypothetical protein
MSRRRVRSVASMVGLIALSLLVALVLATACGSAFGLPDEEPSDPSLKPLLHAIGEVSASGELLWSTGALTVTRTERLMPGAYAIYVDGLTAHTTIQAIPRGAPAMTLSVVDDGYGLAQGYIGVAFSTGTTPVDRSFFFQVSR